MSRPPTATSTPASTPAHPREREPGWRDAFFTRRTSVTINGRAVLVKTLLTHLEQHRRHVVSDGSRSCQTCTRVSVCAQCLRVAVAGVLLRRQDRQRGLERRLSGVELVDQVPAAELATARTVVNDVIADHPLNI